MNCNSIIRICLLWGLVIKVDMVQDDVKQLKNLFKQLLESTEKTIKTLEADETNDRLCVSIPTVKKFREKASPTAFYVYLTKLNKFHKFSLKLPNTFLRPRINAQVSRDIDLGRRIGEIMKIESIHQMDTKEMRMTLKFREVACTLGKTSRKFVRRSPHDAYLQQYQLLRNTSKYLFETRFVNAQ